MGKSMCNRGREVKKKINVEILCFRFKPIGAQWNILDCKYFESNMLFKYMVLEKFWVSTLFSGLAHYFLVSSTSQFFLKMYLKNMQCFKT